MTDHSQERPVAGATPRKDPQSEPTQDPLADARQRIARLQVADKEHESSERALRERTHELGERVKELNCLYSISNLLERPNISLHEILQGAADLIPPAWQYPEIAAARIIVEGEAFRTENWTDGAPCQQSAEIVVRGQPSGSVEVCYLQERPESNEGPFLREERGLLNAIAERLSRVIERIRAEQALEQSEREHRTLFETMTQGVVYQDAAGRITLANPAAERILGLTLAQMQGRTSVDPRWRAIHPDGSDFLGDTHPSMTALRTGCEVRDVVMGVYNPKMEAHTWININAVPQFRPGQESPYQVYTTFEDITERVLATDDLRTERDRAQLYLDIAGVILVVLAPDQTVSLINKKGCEVLGYDEDQIIGQNWFERFVPQRNRTGVLAAFEQLMAGEITPIEYFENAIITRSGQERVITWHNTVLRDAAGRIIGTLSSGEDSTERVRAAQALRESEERFRVVSQLTSDGAYALRIGPDGAIEIEWATEAFTHVAGLTPAEFNNIDRWLDRIHPFDLPIFEKRMRAILDRRKDVSVYRVRTGDGQWRWLRDYGRPVWDQARGRVVRVYGAVQDITDQVLAEKELRQAHDELEQRVKERTAEIEGGRQRESVLNALLRLSMEETSLDEQLERALDQILDIPWLPVLRQGAIFVTETDGGSDSSSGEKVLCLRAHRGLGPALQSSCAQIRFGQCLCGRAAAEGEIEFADRVDERHDIVYPGMAPHGHYCVPVLSSKASDRSGEHVIGMVVLYLKEGHQRNDQEEAFLRAVAYTLAGMIERGWAANTLRQNEQQLRELNRRLEAYSRTLEQRVRERTYELERRRQVAESLRDILAVLNSDRPLDEVLEYIVTEAGRLLQSDTSAIYRPREQGDRFEIQTVKGQSMECSDRTPLSPHLAQVLREGQPVTFSDILAGEPASGRSGISRPLPPGCLVQGCRAVLAVPLVIADVIYGALVLCYTQGRAFAEDEVELAVAFADQAALAIENARLHQHAREAAIVQERARLARELHDSVTQSLYSLTLLAEGWRRLGSAGRLADTDDPLKELGELAQQALKEMRLMVYELRPPALEQEGLLGALHQRLGAVERRAGVEARLLAQEIVELPAPLEEDLYRIAIEALNNALKHASATTVTVLLNADGEWVTLEVTDDGQGFDPETVRDNPGMGLHTMRERAERMSGALIVRSARGEGTSVSARVPFRAKAPL